MNSLAIFFFSHQQKHIMAERNVLLKNVKHPFLVGLNYSFQTKDKLYFVLDFVNGGEVSICGWEAQGWHLPYHISKPLFGRLNQYVINIAIVDADSDICHCMT